MSGAFITQAVKYPKVVIPAYLPLRRKGARTQKNTGCRIKPGMTGWKFSRRINISTI